VIGFLRALVAVGMGPQAARFRFAPIEGAQPPWDARMTNRSRGREVALQLLFQLDHNPTVARADIERFLRERLRETALETFCLSLYDGVVSHLADIDQRLAQAAENWRLPRMAAVDRNVLRLGAWE